MSGYRDPERDGEKLSGEKKKKWKSDTGSGMSGSPNVGSLTDTVDRVDSVSSGGRTPPPALRFFFSYVFPYIFVVVGAVVAFWGGRGLLRARESVQWPVAHGVVMESSVRSSHSSKGGTTYHAAIRYEYTVDGVVHSGDRVAYGDYGSSNSSHARGVVNKYPVGKKVEVHYMPGNPDEALLEPGLQAQAFFIPAFGVVFFLAGVMTAIFIPRAMRKKLPTH